MKVQEILKKLKRIVGAEWVRRNALTGYYYGSDVITYMSEGAVYPENYPLFVVFPGTTKDAALPKDRRSTAGSRSVL